jgi:hypothetical protein
VAISKQLPAQSIQLIDCNLGSRSGLVALVTVSSSERMSVRHTAPATKPGPCRNIEYLEDQDSERRTRFPWINSKKQQCTGGEQNELHWQGVHSPERILNNKVAATMSVSNVRILIRHFKHEPMVPRGIERLERLSRGCSTISRCSG